MYLMGPSCACSMVAVTCPVLALMNCTVLSHAAAKVSLSSMTKCFHKEPLGACKRLSVLPKLLSACELKAATYEHQAAVHGKLANSLQRCSSSCQA